MIHGRGPEGGLKQDAHVGQLVGDTADQEENQSKLMEPVLEGLHDEAAEKNEWMHLGSTTERSTNGSEEGINEAVVYALVADNPVQRSVDIGQRKSEEVDYRGKCNWHRC